MRESEDQKLERLVQHALSGLPSRRAPAALQRRVWEELARRAESPWWRRSFSQWPMAARTAFVALCMVLAGLSLSSLFPSNGLTQQFGMQLESLVKQAIGVMALIGDVANLAASVVPPSYIHMVLGMGALLYAALFAIGAFAYRMLYLQPPIAATIRS